MKFKHILTATALAVLFSSPAISADPIKSITLINRLEEASRDCGWKARNLTGGPKGKMLLHKRTIDSVLEQLQAGQEVDAKKLELALMIHPS
jgi:hypothetical protein